jgi:O-antigen ligase
MAEATLKPIVADTLWQRFRDALPPGIVCAVVALIGILVPALLLYYSMFLVIGAVVVLLGMVVVLSSPYLGLLIFLGLLYLRPEEMFPALTGARLTLTVSLAALFAWAINALLCRERFLLHLPVVRCLLGFVVIAVGSTGNSAAGTVGVVALDLLKLLVLFVLVVHLVSTEGRLRVAAGAIVLFSVILGARTLWQYLHGQALVQSDGDVRALATGIFGDPNDLALAMAMALPLALGAAMEPGRWWSRLWNLAAVPVLLWTVYVTDSRGGVVATAACLFLFFRRRMGRAGLVLGAVAVLGLFVFGPSRMSKLSADEESAQGRVIAWQAGLQMLKRSPLWGVGKDQFVENHQLTAHNSLMLCLAEVGLLGTACWIGLFYFTLGDARRTAVFLRSLPRPGGKGEQQVPAPGGPHPAAAKPKARADRCHSALLQISLITFCVGGFFLSRTYTPPLYVFLGLAVAAAQVEAESSGLALPGASGRDWGRILAITLGGVLLMTLLVRLWR